MYFEKKCCIPRSLRERNFRVKSAKISGKERLHEAKMFFSRYIHTIDFIWGHPRIPPLSDQVYIPNLPYVRRILGASIKI